MYVPIVGFDAGNLQRNHSGPVGERAGEWRREADVFNQARLKRKHKCFGPDACGCHKLEGGLQPLAPCVPKQVADLLRKKTST